LGRDLIKAIPLLILLTPFRDLGPMPPLREELVDAFSRFASLTM
jgi:hypothetical protein